MNSNYVKILLGYLAGIILSQMVDLSILIIFCLALFLCCLFDGAVRRKNVFIRITVGVFLLFGACNFGYHINPQFMDSAAFEDNYVTISGKISDLPVTYDNETYYYIVEGERLSYNGAVYNTDDTYRVSIKYKYPYGAHINVSGFLEQFSDKLNSNSFDSKLYYKSKHIFFKLYAVEHTEFAGAAQMLSFYDSMNTVRAKLSDTIDRFYDGRAAALLKAILIGYKSDLDSDYQITLQKSGVSRFLYTPFVHLFLINSIFSIIFAYIKLPKKGRELLMILVLVLYAACNSSRPIFLKSSIIFCLLIYHRYKNGYCYYPDLLAVTVLAVTIANPLYLYDVGFILAVTFNIVFYNFAGHLDQKLSFIQTTWVRRAVILWMIGMIGLYPVYAYFFAGTSTLMVIMTFIMMPLVVCILIISPFFMLTVWIIGDVGIFGTMTAFLLRCIDAAAQVGARLPFAYISVSALNLREVLCFYLILYIIKLKWDGRLKTFYTYTVMASAASLICVGIVSSLLTVGTLSMTFINVGQGDGAVISMPFREKILIDGGGAPVYSSYNVGKYVYVPYLKQKGYTSISAAIVSHYHKDHCEGILEAVKELKVRNLFLPDCDPENIYRRLLEEAAEKAGTNITYMQAGTTLRYQSGLEITILSPDQSALNSDDLNDTSIVCEIKYGGFSALFTGDATAKIEKQLLQENKLGEYSLVKVPHHGSETSSSEAFVRRIRAEYGIISVGEENEYDLPSDEILRRYQGADTKILRMDETGDILVTADKKGIKHVKTYKGD